MTEEGIAVNPMRDDLRERLLAQGLHIVEIEHLRARAALQAPASAFIDRTTRPAALIEYRDGTVIDVVNTIE